MWQLNFLISLSLSLIDEMKKCNVPNKEDHTCWAEGEWLIIIIINMTWWLISRRTLRAILYIYIYIYKFVGELGFLRSAHTRWTMFQKNIKKIAISILSFSICFFVCVFCFIFVHPKTIRLTFTRTRLRRERRRRRKYVDDDFVWKI